MRSKHFPRAAAFIALAASVAPAGAAESYPARPLRIIAAEAGGGTDFIARLVALGLGEALSQPVVVVNRATAVIGQLGAQAAPDGYSLLVAGPVLWLTPFLREATPYDPVKDFAPISLTTRSPNIIVVNPVLPVNSVTELIALAKSRSTDLNYGTAGVGTSPHLAAELFQSMTGISLVHVPYKGSGPALAALVGGQLQLAFPNASSVAAHVKAGRLRALAVTSADPSPLLPGLPTVSASGLPGYESTSQFGLFAPAKTQAAIINRLNQEVVRILNRPDMKERFLSSGSEVVASSPAQLAGAIRKEMDVLGKLIKKLGIRSE